MEIDIQKELAGKNPDREFGPATYSNKLYYEPIYNLIIYIREVTLNFIASFLSTRK